MNSLNIHSVKVIRLSEVRLLEECNSYVRDINIDTEEGFFQISIFSDNTENLEVDEK